MEKVLGSYHIFPFHRIPKNDRIVIWGFGEIGQHYYEQIKKTNYCQIEFIVDKNWSKFQHDEVEVFPPEKIKEIINIHIVIANVDPKIACQIQDQLIKWNIKKELIVWDDLICERELYAKILNRGETRCMNDMKFDKRIDEVIKKVEQFERRIDHIPSDRNLEMEGAFARYTEIINNLIIGVGQQNNMDIVDVKKLIKNAKFPMIDCTVETLKKFYSILDIVFEKKLQPYNNMSESVYFDLACIWGSKPTVNKSKLIAIAIKRHIPIVFFEDGFLESIVHGSEKNVEKIYKSMHSLTMDAGGAYFMGGKSTALERLLNSDRELNDWELSRARNLIDIICKEKISKYNHQPDFLPIIGESGRKKVLVIDQVWSDQSICDGLSDDSVFSRMLDCAIEENPDADIIVKAHPVSRLTNFPQHFENTVLQKNVYKLEEGTNPISLLESVDKVYVCTSQMGFEAVMLGKDVHVFGMPFYAGWGVTHDYLKCPRRIKKRSVEEIFYMAYIECSMYVNYQSKKVCEIEEAIDELIKLKSIWNTNQSLMEM